MESLHRSTPEEPATLRPVEAVKDATRKAGRGRSERTPWIALAGVQLAVAAIVAVILAAALLVYFLA